MKKANIYEFRTNFARYAKCVREGETITLCDHNKPFAEVRSLGTTARVPEKRPLGLYKGTIILAPDFDDPKVNRKIARGFLSSPG